MKFWILIFSIVTVFTSCSEKKFEKEISVHVVYDQLDLIDLYSDYSVDESHVNALKYCRTNTALVANDIVETYVNALDSMKQGQELSSHLYYASRTNPGNLEIESKNMSNQELTEILKINLASDLKSRQMFLKKQLSIFPHKITEWSTRVQELKFTIQTNTESRRIASLFEKSLELEMFECYHNYEVAEYIYAINEKLGEEQKLTSKVKIGEFKISAVLDTIWKNETNSEQYDSLIDYNTYDDIYPTEIQYKKDNPLSAILIPNVIEQNGQYTFNVERSSVYGFAQASDTAKINEFLNRSDLKNLIPAELNNLAFFWGMKEDKYASMMALYCVKTSHGNNKGLITSANIDRADWSYNTSRPNEIEVNVNFNKEAQEIWSDITEQSAKNKTGIAITLDRKVISAPVANSRITSAGTLISGDFTREEAEDLSNCLNAAQTSVKISVVSIEEKTINKR